MIEEIGKNLGWVVVWTFAFALILFVIRYINKNYMTQITNKLKGKKNYLDLYRKVIGFIVKNHKAFGLTATVVVFLHLIIMWKYVEISVSGLVALVLMVLVAGVGMFSTYLKKQKKAPLTKLHSILAGALLVAIIIHLT